MEPQITKTPNAASQDQQNKITRFIQQFSDIASSSVGKVRIQVFLSLLCAAWLTFYVTSLISLHLLVKCILLLILCLPGFLLLKLNFILQDIADLPDKLCAMGENFTIIKDNYKNRRLQEIETPQPGTHNKLKTLFKMSKTLFALKDALGGVLEFSGMMQDVMLLANPVFIILTIGAFITSWFFLFISFITLMVFLI